MTAKSQAFFLVAHGSRSPQSQSSFNQLSQTFQSVLTQRGMQSPWVKAGCLEFDDEALSQQLVSFWRSLPAEIKTIHILPVFLLPGNHVHQDIPTEIQQAWDKIQQHAPRLTQSPFCLAPHLGAHPNLATILRDKMQATPCQHWILLGHGSRRPEGNQVIADLADQIDAMPAFWATQPTLANQIQALHSQGIRQIGVLPYFLFSGKITQAIAQQATDLIAQYPDLSIQVLSPLKPSQPLAEALFDFVQINQAALGIDELCLGSTST